MDEFALIREVVANLGDRAGGRWVELGPGDDAAIIAQTPGCQAVASIDTLLAGVHFPETAAPEDVGYRALMVGLSDLAAMAAQPRYVLVALTLPQPDPAWVGRLAQGMAAAARDCDTYLCGGNFARGTLSITVSVHGEVPVGAAVTRSGATPGDRVYVSGDLGGAAACVRTADFNFSEPQNLSQQRYLHPRARFDLQQVLRAHATAAIDISDGLVVDMTHICTASGVSADLSAAVLPLCEGAQLDDALFGGDDYQILCTAAEPVAGLTCIGEITTAEETTGPSVSLDGQPLRARGYNHFDT